MSVFGFHFIKSETNHSEWLCEKHKGNKLDFIKINNLGFAEDHAKQIKR